MAKKKDEGKTIDEIIPVGGGGGRKVDVRRVGEPNQSTLDRGSSKGRRGSIEGSGSFKPGKSKWAGSSGGGSGSRAGGGSRGAGSTGGGGKKDLDRVPEAKK